MELELVNGVWRKEELVLYYYFYRRSFSCAHLLESVGSLMVEKRDV